MFGRKEENETSRIIIDEKIVSVSDLKRKARRANTRFWSLAVGMSLISSMVLPYMSLASTVASGDSNVFKGEVVPGYSMGGIDVTAYGVDINSWGMVSKDTVVGSTYGVWSGERLSTARTKMGSSESRVVLAGNQISANTNLQSSDKSVGWQTITGRTSYTADAPDGQEANSQSNQYDAVAPYRTVNDANYWDRCKPSSSGNASASINVSLLPDFIIVGVTETDGGLKATILQSPDEIASDSNRTAGLLWSTQGKANSSSAAVPYYVPLSVLFDKYGLNDPSTATLANLLDKMHEQDPDGTLLAGYAQDNDLLSFEENSKNMMTYDVNHGEGTGKNGTESSNAFNPYPYSMVFSQDTKNGRITSSIYNNAEAYVYFSPSSMYSKYIALRNEYNQIKSIADSDNTLDDIRIIVQLGYYAASMAVLEAYLDEALPQDMTRGYVGPSEPDTIATSKTSSLSTGNIAGDGVQKAGLTGEEPAIYQKVSYATIMYDVVKTCNADGSKFRLSETNAIMDTLSTFGYAVDRIPGTGVMKGLTASEYLMRYNALTPHAESAYNTNKVEKVAQKTESSSSSGGASGGASGGDSGSGLGDPNAQVAATREEEKAELANSWEKRIQWIKENSRSQSLLLYDTVNGDYYYGANINGTIYDMYYGQAISSYRKDTCTPGSITVWSTDVNGKELAVHLTNNHSTDYYPFESWNSCDATAAAMINYKYGNTGPVIDDDAEITTVSIPQASAGTTTTTTNIATGQTGSNTNKTASSLFGSSYSAIQAILGSAALEGIKIGSNRSGVTIGKSEPDKQKGGYSGIYVPPYYPIQQHKIDQSEMQYRFPIIATVPYDVVTQYIRELGFSSGVSLSYASGDNDASITNFIDITDAENKVAALAALYEKAEKSSLAAGLYLATVQYGTNRTDEAQQMIAVYGDSASGFSKDDLSIKDSESVSDEEARKVTAARIDAALLGYAASNMSADNVHDLFDVVRATVGVKMETWFRFYNPIKSEGGDTDFFVTRISPARTTYLPSVLMNGYTAAGGREISPDLTTVNCSFDYYSTPSFAPCFASHTADDCYYGVLNYEQRAFYSKGFIETLSQNANIPAVELAEEMEDAIRQINSEQAKENQIMWTDVATLFVMGKRLAYIQAALDIVQGRSAMSWDEYLKITCENNGTGAWKESRFDDIAYDLIYQGKGSADNDWEYIAKQGPAFSVKFQNDTAPGKGSLKFEDALMYSTGSSSGDAWGQLKAYDDDMNPLLKAQYGEYDEGGHSSGGAVDLSDPMQVKVHGMTKSDGTEISLSKKMPSDIYFTAIFDQKFNSLLGNSGKYYWVDPQKALDKIKDGSVTIAVDEDGGGPPRDAELKYIHAAGFHLNFLQDLLGSEKVGDEDIVAKYEAVMKDASSQIAKAVINLVKDMKLLQDSMPNQMMNCLAWADYKNSADSEESYQFDPTEPNVTFNLYEQGLQTYDADWVEKNGVTGRKDLPQYNVEFVESDGGTDSAGAIRLTGTGEDANGNLQSRMVRGVEGATWTSTEQLAAYSISSTIQRVQFMSNETGSTYPYSGLANGRLQSGAERYEVMQSHVIDYAALASGIKGDLSVRQRAKVVSITNPEYSSITDFLNVLGNIGALLGELGKSMLRTTSEAFNAMMFPPKNTTAAKTNATQAAKSMAATMVYTTPSGITMNRLPASATTYDVNAGQMTLKPIVSSSSAAMSNAAGVSAVTQFGGLLLNEGHSLYALLQTFGLTLVMVFIGFIAFRNFYAYSVSNSAGMLVGQTQLKVVLPRSILAIFMIGLPPMAAGSSIGFEGGNYLILSLISNVMEFITGIFMNLNGQAIMSVFDINMSSAFGGDIFAYLIYFLCCLVLSACFLVGVVCIFIQTLLLFGFFLVGPIAWAFYVWPYNATTDNEGAWSKGNAGGGFLTSLTQKMNFGLFTSHRAGNLAPMGLVFNYTVIAGLTVAWALIFWFISMIFVGTTFTGASSAAASASAAIAATGYPQASAALLGNSATDMFSLFNLSDSSATYLKMLFATVIAVVAFVIMTRLLWSTFRDTVGLQKTVAGKTIGALKNAMNDPAKLAAMAGKAADVVGKMPGLPGMAGKAAGAAGKAAGAAKQVAEKAGDTVSKAKKLGAAVDTAGKELPGAAAGKKAQGMLEAAKKAAEKPGAKAKELASGAALGAAESKDKKDAKTKADAKKDAKSLEKGDKESKEVDTSQMHKMTIGTKEEHEAGYKAAAQSQKKRGLEQKLRELSNEDNARRAIAKRQALTAGLDNLSKGNILGAAGDMMMARDAYKTNQKLGNMAAEKGLTDATSKAIDQLAAGEISFDDLDAEVKQNLKALGAVDSHGNFNKSQAHGAKDLLAKRSAELEKEMKDTKALQEVRKDVLSSFNNTGSKTGKALADNLSASMSADGRILTASTATKQATNEMAVQAVMAEHGLGDDERADAEAMVALRDNQTNTKALAGVRRAGNDAVAQQRALQDAQFAIDDDIAKLGSDEAKHAYVADTFGQACSQEKYIEYQTDLASGKSLSAQAAKEVMAFEAHARIDNAALPNALPPDRTETSVEQITQHKAAYEGKSYTEIGDMGSEYRNASGNIISVPQSVSTSLRGEMWRDPSNVARVYDVAVQSIRDCGIDDSQMSQWIGDIGELSPDTLMRNLISVSSNMSVDPAVAAAASMAIQGVVGMTRMMTLDSAGANVEMLQGYQNMAVNVPTSGQVFQTLVTAGMSDAMMRMFSENNVFADADGNARTAQEAYDIGRKLCENFTAEMCDQYGVDMLDAQKYLIQSSEQLLRVAQDQAVQNECHPMAAARYGAQNVSMLENGRISLESELARVAEATGDTLLAYSAASAAGAAYVTRLEDAAAKHAEDAMITRAMLAGIAEAHQSLVERYGDRPMSNREMRAAIAAKSTLAYGTAVENGLYDVFGGVDDAPDGIVSDFQAYAIGADAYRAFSHAGGGYAVPVDADRQAVLNMISRSTRDPETAARAMALFEMAVSQELDEAAAESVFDCGYGYYDTMRAYNACADDLLETYLEGTDLDALARQRKEGASGRLGQRPARNTAGSRGSRPDMPQAYTRVDGEERAGGERRSRPEMTEEEIQRRRQEKRAEYEQRRRERRG